MSTHAPHKLVVSVINFRTAELTLACIRSVLADIGDLDVQVVVVDNASGDGSDDAIADWIAAQPKGTPVRLVRSPTNSGFSGGHNQGIGALAAEYYLVLNSDAVLRPGFIAAILAAAECYPRAGLIAPVIETEGGVVQVSAFRFHSPWSELVRGASSAPVTRLLRRHVVALPPPVAQAEIDWVSFACVLLRAEMIGQIGLMDEGYFLYFEDAEYCLRARRAGWEIARAPRAVAVHFRGGSGPVKALEKARKRLPPYYYASRARFFRHAHGPFGPVLANALWYLGRGLAQTRRLFGKPVPGTVEAEARDIWINSLQPLGPRHAPGE